MAANLSKLTMRLFGLPYQFPKAVDPRLNEVSSTIGKKFTENILLEAPVCTIIPGEPVYLPGQKTGKKISTSSALIEKHNGNLSILREALGRKSDNDLRLYDFKNNYTEYMKYVNVLCRTGAVFLELDDTVTWGSEKTSFQTFDWKNYRWNSMGTTSMTSKVNSARKTVAEKIKGVVYSLAGKELVMDSENGAEGSLEGVLTNYNFIQFYVDPDSGPSDTLSNQVGESSLKSMMDSGSSTMKEIAFMANSGGIDTETLATFMEGSSAALQAGLSAILGNNSISGALNRIINLGSNVLQGHNIIIPDVYQSSSYSKPYQLTIHLKSPYGTKLGYYLDIFVPMMHLLALAMPTQESANTFSSPFLIKAYIDGVYSCNLGMVENISITKSTESYSVSGLPSEVDVTLNIVDLYSDLSMSPSSSPMLFANNSSLVEYLATNCGITLTAPNFKTKWNNIINTTISSFTDIPSNIKSSVEEKIYSTIASMTSLYK